MDAMIRRGGSARTLFIHTFRTACVLLGTAFVSLAQGQDEPITIEQGGAPGRTWAKEPNGEPFLRPIYAVGVKELNWTRTDGGVSAEARAYYPIGVGRLCPVVIYSHGLGGSIEQFEYLGRRWASRGIISVHIRHPESDASQWKGKPRPKNELKELYRQCWSGRDRALLIHFVIDRLTEIAGRPGTVGENIDLQRIGVAGNDLGALAALLVAGQLPPDNGPSLKDDRVSAVIALSPPVYCTAGRAPLVYGEIKTAFLSFAGTKDDGVVGTTKAFQRRIPFDGMSGNPRYHVTLEGGDHMVYAGHLRTVRQTKDPVYQSAIRNISLLFWSAYLQNDTMAQSILSESTAPYLSNVGRLEKRLQ